MYTVLIFYYSNKNVQFYLWIIFNFSDFRNDQSITTDDTTMSVGAGDWGSECWDLYHVITSGYRPNSINPVKEHRKC